MAKLAIKYLSAPPTSVPLEFLFSVVRDVYHEKKKLASTRESRKATIDQKQLQILPPIIHIYIYGTFMKIYIYSIAFSLNLVKIY